MVVQAPGFRAAGAALLVALLLLEVPAVSFAQPLDPVAAADAAFGQRSGARKGGLITTGNPSVQPAPISIPPGTRVLEISKTVKELPTMSAMTMTEMKGMYSGPTAPRAGRERNSGPKPLANGLDGPSFSDSRFTSDYVTLGQGRVGRLLMRFNGTWYGCTASVIQKALLLTAGHCVCEWGKGSACWPDSVDGEYQVYFELDPEGDRSKLVTFSAIGLMVAAAYAYGTDTTVSDAAGIIVNNDLALVWLAPNGTNEVGDFGGWNAYGWNGYGFAEQLPSINGFPAAPASAMQSCVAYSGDQDRFRTLQISHSAAYNMLVAPVRNWHKRQPRASVQNMVRGTSFQPGSSGSPWIVNYGFAPVLRYPNLAPLQGERNVVIGVTSWGSFYENNTALAGYSGASFFGVNPQFPGEYGTRGSGNIAAFIYDACDAPGGWELTAKKLCVDG